MSTTVPPRYELFNSLQTKQISIVCEIEGIPFKFTNRPIYTRILYGDPGIDYGDPGIVYGGLRKVENVKDLLSLEGSSLSVTQKVEPEKGKGSISVFSLAFIDKNQLMSQVISPGVYVPEILGRRVKVSTGYVEGSFPEDYFQVFYGYISGVTSRSGLVTIQLSDPGFKKRQQLFFQAKTKLTSPISNVQTTIPVASTSDFHQLISSPGGVDSTAQLFLKIDDEFIEYTNGTTGPSSFSSVTRGCLGSVGVPHNIGAEVAAYLQIESQGVPLALKLMLSGWNGYWTTGEPIYSIVNTTFPSIGNIEDAIILPQHVDAVAGYGLVVGDWVTITGASNPANNVTTIAIAGFQDLYGQPNRVILLEAGSGLVAEVGTSGTLSFRSKYDTLPVSCGLRMTPQDVDVARHEYYSNVFLTQTDNSFRFLVSSPASGKEFIESQIYLPLGAYSVTRRGRLAMNLARPPLPDESLQFITSDEVLNPQDLAPTRATNSRKFFNQVNCDYDYNSNGAAESVVRTLDSESLSLIGVLSVLPITSQGGRTDKGAALMFQRRARQFLSRYKRGALELTIKVNWKIASLVEVGDVVLVEDNGKLQITNFDTGVRNLGVGVFEVVSRTLDFKAGNAMLGLVSGVGYNLTDRYGTWSPSSVVTTGTTTTLEVGPSFGAIFDADEGTKWENFIGLNLRVHDYAWTKQATVTLLGIDPTNANRLLVSTLPFSPVAGDIVDIAEYPTDIDPETAKAYKLLHFFFDPYATVVTGISSTQFTVSPGDASKFQVGFPVRVHNASYSSLSPEVKVSDVTGTTITVDSSLGFTPSGGMQADLLGFPDGAGPYRWV